MKRFIVHHKEGNLYYVLEAETREDLLESLAEGWVILKETHGY